MGDTLMPTFTKIEYWNELTANWEVGHNGINLINPAKYIEKLANRGTIARAVLVDTGEILYADGGDLL